MCENGMGFTVLQAHAQAQQVTVNAKSLHGRAGVLRVRLARLDHLFKLVPCLPHHINESEEIHWRWDFAWFEQS